MVPEVEVEFPVVEFLKAHHFDGIDIDWEFPTFAAVGGNDRTLGRTNDKADFVTLLADLKKAFQPYGFVLSATVAGAKDTIDRAYDVARMSQTVDFLNVMAFDYETESKSTAYSAPLYSATESKHDKTANVDFTIRYLMQKGAAPEKIVLGIPLYGKAYKLAGADSKLGARAVSVNDAPTARQVRDHPF